MPAEPADPSEQTTRLASDLSGELASGDRVARPSSRDGHALEPATRVDQYEIVRLLDRGGMGEIYLARDLELARKVALKVIHPRLLGDDKAVADFLAEARITAKFDHPHIVALYGAGEYRGSPYVALAYLEGQNLRERLKERRPSRKEALRLALAIAEALQEAHRHGVLHRDLKPANVVIPKDGRPRVLDFGIAQAERPPASSRLDHDEIRAEAGAGSEQARPSSSTAIGGGSPGYMAPEQWRNEDCTPQTDVWALGVTLFEMLAGRRPYLEPTMEERLFAVTSEEPAPRLDSVVDAPDALVQLVARCLLKEADERPTASEVVAQLRAMLREGPQLPEGDQSPFRALMPFTEKHAALFFGRDGETAAFVERLRHTASLLVVGPSGAGKSSFVRAGVIPRLMEQERWTVLRLRPGAEPLRALAVRLHDRDADSFSQLAGKPRQLDGSEASVEDTEAELRAAPGHLSLMLRGVAEQTRGKVLLFVDQLEELFTLGSDQKDRRLFLEAVAAAADDPLEPIRAVFTVRSDFLDRLAVSPSVRDALGSVMVMQRLGAESLHDALLRPLQAMGYAFEEPELVDEMVAAVQGEPASLPLLQFAAQMLWERRDRDRKLVLRRVHDEMGGVVGALTQHADGVLEGFTQSELGLARDMLLRMVTAERTRRVVTREQVLEGLGEGIDADAERVLTRLVEARLVSVSKQPTQSAGEATLELAHEALIHSWRTLSGWLDAGTEELALIAQLGQAAELWRSRGERPEELWSGEPLEEARRALATSSVVVPPLVKAFVESGRERTARQAKRRRLLIGAAIAALLLGVVVLAWQKREADQQRGVAEAQRQRADILRAEALREGARAALERGAMLEARSKLRLAFELQDDATARALWWRLTREPLVWNMRLGANGYDVAFSPDGQQIAVASQDKAIHLFDVVTRSTHVLRGHRDQVFTLAYSPDGSKLASGSWGGEVWLWDTKTGSKLNTLGQLDSGVRSLSFSSDGEQLVTGGFDKTVRVWPLDGGKPRKLGEHTGRVWSVRFSPDGKQVASASDDDSVRVWNVSGGLAHTLTGHDGPARCLRFAPNGTLISTGDDGVIRFWDVTTGKQTRTLEGEHRGALYALAVDAAGKRLVSGGIDRSVRVWDLDSGKVLHVLAGHGEGLRAVSISADGKRVATTGADESVKLWEPREGQSEGASTGHAGPVYGVAFRDGVVASAGGDRTVRLWNADSGEVVRVFEGLEGSAFRVHFSPDGKWLAAGSDEQDAHVWETATGATIKTLSGHEGSIGSVRFSPDGKLLATTGLDGFVRLWRTDDWELVRTLGRHEGLVNDVEFDAAGERLATASTDRTVRIWSVSSGAETQVLRGHQDAIFGASFAPDGKHLASGSFDGTLRLWDLASGEAETISQLKGRQYEVDFHPDGRRVIVSCSDDLARVWDLETHTAVELRGHQGEVNFAAFSDDGRLAVTSGDDGTVRVWDATTGRPHWRAPALLRQPARLFTHRGWIALGGGEAKGPAKLTAMLAKRAHSASSSPDGKLLCARRYDDGMELWDVATDARLAEHAAPGVTTVIALDGGCVFHDGKVASMMSRDGSVKAIDATGELGAMAVADGQLLLLIGEELALLSDGQETGARIHVGAGATAVARTQIGDAAAVVVGYRDGSIELVPRGDAEPFERVGSSAVVRLLPGPRNTMIAGFADGSIGMWNQQSGAHLAGTRIHGPVVHLLLEDGTLHAASSLGSHTSWNLDALDRDECELMRQIWEQTPTVWVDGRAVRQEPPAEHRCAPR